MKTDELLKTIGKYSLQQPSLRSDERIEGILKKRIASLQSIQKKSQFIHSFSYSVWKYMFSAAAGVAVLIFTLNYSISKEDFLRNGIITTTNSHYANLTAITNNDAHYRRTQSSEFVSALLTSSPASCEQVSLNCWKMVSN